MPVTLYNVSFSSRLSECGASVCHSLCSHTEACSLCTVTVFWGPKSYGEDFSVYCVIVS